jgi:hypothetical protein
MIVMSGDNIKISAEELRQIRELPDFDLTMLLSEVNDFGWDPDNGLGGKHLLPMIMNAIATRKQKETGGD